MQPVGLLPGREVDNVVALLIYLPGRAIDNVVALQIQLPDREVDNVVALSVNLVHELDHPLMLRCQAKDWKNLTLNVRLITEGLINRLVNDL